MELTHSSDLSELKLIAAYREARGHVFGSAGSLDWFIRHHKHDLIACGALVLLTGRWFANPQKFDDFVLASASKNAAQRA